MRTSRAAAYLRVEIAFEDGAVPDAVGRLLASEKARCDRCAYILNFEALTDMAESLVVLLYTFRGVHAYEQDKPLLVLLLGDRAFDNAVGRITEMKSIFGGGLP